MRAILIVISLIGGSCDGRTVTGPIGGPGPLGDAMPADALLAADAAPAIDAGPVDGG